MADAARAPPPAPCPEDGGWRNWFNHTCRDYVHAGWCRGGAVPQFQQRRLRAGLSPERACCACAVRATVKNANGSTCAYTCRPTPARPSHCTSAAAGAPADDGGASPGDGGAADDDDDDVAAVAPDLVAGARDGAGAAGAASVVRVADKNLFNWRFVPLLAALQPSARVVRLVRHPLDAALSNFFKLFTEGCQQCGAPRPPPFRARRGDEAEALPPRARGTRTTCPPSSASCAPSTRPRPRGALTSPGSTARPPMPMPRPRPASAPPSETAATRAARRTSSSARTARGCSTAACPRPPPRAAASRSATRRPRRPRRARRPRRRARSSSRCATRRSCARRPRRSRACSRTRASTRRPRRCAPRCASTSRGRARTSASPARSTRRAARGARRPLRRERPPRTITRARAQVRRPLNRDSIGGWRDYEPYMRAAIAREADDAAAAAREQPANEGAAAREGDRRRTTTAHA